MSGLYRGYVWAYWFGMAAGILVITHGWWGVVPGLVCGIVAAGRQVR